MSCRIGCVPFLNARPLVFGIEHIIQECVPSRLADLLHRAQFDVGLVPIAEVLLHDQYDILDGIAIASQGAVASVFLIHREPLESIKRVGTDTASRTSVMLLRVLLKQQYGIEPEFYPLPQGAKLADHEAMLLIGDNAIGFVSRRLDVNLQLHDSWITGPGGKPSYSILDLGEAWLKLTGLPFVYAVWAGQKDLFQRMPEIASLLRNAKANGLAHLDQIVQDTDEATPEFRREYLTRFIRFDLGTAEKQAVSRFQKYAVEMGLVPACHDLRYNA